MSLAPDAVVAAVIDELAVEELDRLLFRGKPNQWESGHVFGGHVVGQALHAASYTVDPQYRVHSLHSYFMRPGKADRDILYHVDPIRDGRSFCTRRVVAVQNGEAIFAVAFSYHLAEEGFSHHIEMPDVPAPEELGDDEAYLTKVLKIMNAERKSPPKMPFEMRTIDRVDPLDPQPKNPSGGYWMRLKAPLSEAQRANRVLQTYLLAYQSDFAFMSAAMRPHALFPMHPKMKTVASLDHTMWFHAHDYDIDDWIFYKTEGYWSGGARGLARGALYTRDGRLIASTAQEGLMRMKPDKP